jgi:hypothetical protein
MPDTRTEENWLAGVVSSPAGNRAGPAAAPPLPADERLATPADLHGDLHQEEPDELDEREQPPARRGPLTVIAHFYVGAATAPTGGCGG